MTRQTKRRSMLWALFLTILAGRLNAQGMRSIRFGNRLLNVS